jgi:hypothetical protein
MTHSTDSRWTKVQLIDPPVFLVSPLLFVATVDGEKYNRGVAEVPVKWRPKIKRSAL